MIEKLLDITTGFRTSRRIAAAASVGFVVLFAASPVQAGLKIRPVFMGGLPPAPEMMVGGGDLEEIFKVAAEAWEEVFKGGSGNWDITIEFGWRTLTGPWGIATTLSYGGNNPVRITRGAVEFTNAPGDPGFFADPTPRDSTEYKQYSSYLLDEVPLNQGRVFSQATGDAAGRIDLLTIATHEIGHLLGFDSHYVGYVCLPTPEVPGCSLTITGPRPYAGLGIQLHPQSDHFFEGFFAEGTQPLMVPEPNPGERQLISGLDALAIAELSSFDKPILSGLLPPPW